MRQATHTPFFGHLYCAMGHFRRRRHKNGGRKWGWLRQTMCAPTRTTISTIMWGNYVCRYWEAITHWDMALKLTPEWAELHEMKAQVSMCMYVGEERWWAWVFCHYLHPCLIHHDSITLTSDHRHPIILMSDLPSAHKFRHFINLYQVHFIIVYYLGVSEVKLVNHHYCLLTICNSVCMQ